MKTPNMEMQPANSRYLVFDFDGTIADTLTLALSLADQIIKEYNLTPIQGNLVEQVRSKNSLELIKMFGVSKTELPKLILRLRKEMHHSLDRLKMIPGMLQSLNELKACGYRLGILTSNSQENVQKFLEMNHLNGLFEFIYSGKNIFGKKAIINRMLRQQAIGREEIIYVGDETRDVEASRKAGIPVIAVSWGFNSRELLASSQPNKIADEPEDLLSLAKEIF